MTEPGAFQLPVIERPAFVRVGAPWLAVSLRVLLLTVLVLLIHQHAVRQQVKGDAVLWEQVPWNVVQLMVPDATRWGDPNSSGARTVLDAAGSPIGYVMQTSPDGDRYLGFSGPTKLLLAFGNDHRIREVRILSSRDTQDHVRLIERDRRFLKSWDGMTAQEAAVREEVDGVAGATLTSVAIRQAMQRRLGQTRIEGKFRAAPSLETARLFFPDVDIIVTDEKSSSAWILQDRNGHKLGEVLSTSPAADEVIGFQGPTACHLYLSVDGQVVGVTLAESFDNDPYVGYVRDETGFLELFTRQSLEDLAMTMTDDSKFDGVSGATMTSRAVVEGVVTAARAEVDRRRQPAADQMTSIPLSGKDLAALLVIVAGCLVALWPTRLPGPVRTCMRWLVVVVLGLWSGQVLSLAMFAGWAASGVPWPNAWVLVILAVVAFATPIFIRTNVYCAQLCPHGAIQQLLPRRYRWTDRLPRSFFWTLRALRPVLLVLAVILVWQSRAPLLVHVEPFDAYSWRAAAWSSVTIAALSLVVALGRPMSYCHDACPTGSLLTYLRRHARSFSWTWGDTLLAALVIAVGVLSVFEMSR